MSQKFYIARVSLHCKDMECAEGRPGVSAPTPTSCQLAQRNACDPDLSKSCNGVKGVPRGFASAEPLRGRAPSAETICFLVGRSNRKQEPYGSKERRTSRALSRAPRDSTMRFSEVSTAVRLTGRATGSYAQAALPKPIRLFDKVT